MDRAEIVVELLKPVMSQAYTDGHTYEVGGTGPENMAKTGAALGAFVTAFNAHIAENIAQIRHGPEQATRFQTVREVDDEQPQPEGAASR